MLFYKPESYILPKEENTQPAPLGRTINPTKGEAGNPAIPPTRQHAIMRRGPSNEVKPRFLRDSLANKDIIGAQPKKLYEGRTKDSMSNGDIEGSSPMKLKARNLSEYNIFDYNDVNFKPSARARRVPPSIPTLKVKRPNGESFNMDTNGDHLMRSAKSTRLDPYHMSHYRVNKMTDSTYSHFSPKAKFQRLGEMIQSQSDMRYKPIEKPQNGSMISRNKAEAFDKRGAPEIGGKLNQSVALPSTNDAFNDPSNKFCRNYAMREKPAPSGFQRYRNMNSSMTPEKLAARPIDHMKIDVGSPHGLPPSIQTFNRRGKFY
ncbi:unnamed protein product [Moneuplotes crassus]|uniref:Uncharacterized protein n=1 Tax=Euplotes crassus TaxID=5936 RepID=A0AAD1XJL1_EUPCR|nr:unnamed protein product [Moneuplotes crassus]